MKLMEIKPNRPDHQLGTLTPAGRIARSPALFALSIAEQAFLEDVLERFLTLTDAQLLAAVRTV